MRHNENKYGIRKMSNSDPSIMAVINWVLAIILAVLVILNALGR